MFKIAAAVITVLVMLCVPIGGSLAEEKKELDSAGVDKSIDMLRTTKPVICERTIPLLNKFTKDRHEQLLIQYKDPSINTGGMVWWNAEMQIIHVIEFPPKMMGEWACLIVFGDKAKMDPNGARKKGERPL
jgi:hypothetical protein